MSYSLDSLQDDCYENSTVLKNKFGIKNEKHLNEIEQVLSAINAAEIELNYPIENVDFKYYKKLHQMLFEDIYEWAGKIRSVNMSKKGVNFCNFNSIHENGNRIFGGIKSKSYFVGMKFDSFIDEIVDVYCDLNFLHPFREGNGRGQRLFFTLLIKNAGYDIDFSKIDTELLMIATIKSVSGDIFLLRNIINNHIKEV